VAEFCALGGEVAKQIWVPTGTADLAPYIGQVPESGVDGFVMSANPPTALPFLKSLPLLRGRLADRLIGSIGLTVPPIPETLGRKLDGVVFGAPDDTETPAAKAFDARFSKAFPRLAGQGFFFGAMYADAVNAVLLALEAVDGDLSGGERRFREKLASLRLETPTTGRIRLDSRRQAIGPAYLIQFVAKGGGLGFRTLHVTRDVEQTFGGYFPPDGPAPRTNSIPCRHGNPPPWARSG
jgi:branched-chain amino acid transport system substrate-binding protein